MVLLSRTQVLAIAASLVVAGFVAGYAASYLYTQPTLEVMGAEINDLRERLGQAEKKLLEAVNEQERLESLLSEAEARLSDAQREIAEKQAEVNSLSDRLEREIAEGREAVSRLDAKLSKVREMSERMQKAAALLTQLRSLDQISREREEALNFWSDIKTLATEFDPALTPSVDRIINNIDGWVQYNEWLGRAPGPDAPVEEVVRWLFEFPESANSYFDAVNQLVDEVHTTVASRIIGLQELS